MVATGDFALNGSDGSTPTSRAQAAGYAQQVAEAIRAGQGDNGTPQSTVTGWLSNSGQRAILLAANYVNGGAGVTTADSAPFGPGSHVYSLFLGEAVPGSAPPPPPPPPPPAPAGLQPVAGRSAVVKVLSGTVVVTSSSPLRAVKTLTGTAIVPFGSTIDTTGGRIDFKTATDTAGSTEHSTFYGGAFVPHGFKSGARFSTALKLSGGGAFGACPVKKAGHVTAAAVKKKKKPKRILWGDGKGKYRTEGRTASATVRGTKWLTEDTCDGTKVQVIHGNVRVREKATGKIHTVTTGHSILVPKH
jgi:hypothetical protein